MEKSHTIISEINAEKLLFLIKIPDKLEIEGNYLKIIKATWEKPTNNSMLDGESKSSAFKSTNETGTSTLITAVGRSTGSTNQSI